MTSRAVGLFHRGSRLLRGRPISTLKLAADGDIKLAKSPSFDYFRKGFSLRMFFDPTAFRFNDNSKVIVVEGNIASGKSKVAAKLAEYFGMAYFPDPTEDDIYIDKSLEPYFDLRCHNFLLPKFAKYYTCEMFWNEADLIKEGKGLYLQYHFYLRRYWNYLKALCHLFNTGQGVVIDRSPFSEFAFADAMFKCNYLSERGLLWFKQNHAKTVTELWKPHIMIYIKAPIKQIRERIKKRNIVLSTQIPDWSSQKWSLLHITDRLLVGVHRNEACHRIKSIMSATFKKPWEMNARNLTDDFLNAYEDILGNYYMDNMDRYSYILPVDGSATNVYDDDDIYIIAENACKIDLSGDRLLRDDLKIIEWRRGLKFGMSIKNNRLAFSSANLKFARVFNAVEYPLDIPELVYDYEAQEMQGTARRLDPRTSFVRTFNPVYRNPLTIMFNPWIVSKNFAADLPKQYLWL